MQASANDVQPQARKPVRYVLITQCLQNDFFLNEGCSLQLPYDEVEKMLIGKRSPAPERRIEGDRLVIEQGLLEEGPLGRFLDATIGARMRNEGGEDILHVINIRDWHQPEASYDEERRKYGAHCEMYTWGAKYIKGLDKYLDPDGETRSGDSKEIPRFFRQGSVRIYHIYSDSVFDFKPCWEAGRGPYQYKFETSDLESALDVIMFGSEKDIEDLAGPLKKSTPQCKPDKGLTEMANKVTGRGRGELPRVQVGVIGVYTDIKVKTLLTSLRSRYEIPCLAVSDTLTGSRSLERHLGALDFAQKVLDVEVVHGLNNLVRLLGGGPVIENEADIVAADRFSDYASYFQDKQNVLAHRAQKLQEYLGLIQRRAEDVYRAVLSSNKFLMLWGFVFLSITAAGAVLSAVWPDRFTWKLPLVTGGLSLVQLVTVFFRRPMEDLQRNLTNLAALRMILESHSLKVALARFHLTTPQTLRENIDTVDADKQVKALKDQLKTLETIEKSDRDALMGLGFGVGDVPEEAETQEQKAQPEGPCQGKK